MNGKRGFVVALTGGIASGKSAVARGFRDLDIHVHDADDAARAVVAVGTQGLSEIVKQFGSDVLRADGSLDRAAVRKRVFEDDAARKQLEAIVHPLVNQHLRQLADNDEGPYCVLSIPLLAETWPRYDWVDRVVVVAADAALRRDRLMQRDDIDQALAQRMLDAQASDAQRQALADDIIDNNGAPDALPPQIRRLHATYLDLAARP